MNIILNQKSMVPIYEQIIGQIKASISNGELSSGQILPSVRNLAADLKISSLTVKKAYDRLEDEGILVTVHGKGSFIADNIGPFVSELRKTEIEGEFSKLISKAKIMGLANDEIKDLVTILLGD